MSYAKCKFYKLNRFERLIDSKACSESILGKIFYPHVFSAKKWQHYFSPLIVPISTPLKPLSLKSFSMLPTPLLSAQLFPQRIL